MISLLISLLIIFLVASLVWWVLTLIPIPPPFLNVVRVIFAIILLIVLIEYLLPFAHAGGPYLR